MEKKFQVMEETKQQIVTELTQPDALNTIATQPVPEIDEDDPLEKMLNEKTACQPETLSLSPIEVEMQQYESLPRVGKDMDVCQWWFQNSKKFPVLFEGAKHYLGVAVSSSGSERVFSTCGRIDTARRASLTPDNLERLSIMKENQKVG